MIYLRHGLQNAHAKYLKNKKLKEQASLLQKQKTSKKQEIVRQTKKYKAWEKL